MHHVRAREAISRILASDGFADRALAMTLAAELAEVPHLPAELRDRAFTRSLALAPDRGSLASYVTGESQPNQLRDLCDQVFPLLTRLPGSAGRHSATWYALATLWPHVGGQERPGMRRRFLAGTASLGNNVGGEVSLEQLRDWQRDLATQFNSDAPTLISLGLLLDESNQRRAYQLLADYLGANFAPATLCWVLGGLAVQELLHRRDRDGGLLYCLLGTMSLGRLASQMSNEHLATAISQIAMQLWWWRHQGNLSPVRSCLDGVPRPLGEAVRSGDITAAQRAARVVSANPAVLWKELAAILELALAWNDRLWLRGLSAMVALAWRSGDTLSPDDAAATATVLADLSYQAKLPASAQGGSVK